MMSAMDFPDADTVVDGLNKDIVCQVCGAREPTTLGVPVGVFLKQISAFNRAHADCKDAGRGLFSYSTDGERYRDGPFSSWEDAARAGFAAHPEVDRLWIGSNERRRSHQFVNAHRIVDMVRDEAADWAGEASEYWLSKLEQDRDGLAELRAVVGAFLDKYEAPRFFAARDVREVCRGDIPPHPV